MKRTRNTPADRPLMTHQRSARRLRLAALLPALCVLWFTPCRASGPPSPCRWLDRRVYVLSTHAEPDSLRRMLTLIELSRRCHADAAEADRLAWLTETEVFGLDGLGRLDEAHRAVDRFFARHWAAADSSQRARMYAWRFRFRALRGDLLGAVAAYHEGERYGGSLPLVRQLHGRLDLAYAYLRIGAPADAARYVEGVVSEAEPNSKAGGKFTTTLSEPYGRALAFRAEILLASDTTTTGARIALAWLGRADSVFAALGLEERRAGAQVEQGRALARLGREEEALRAFSEALASSVQTHAPHVSIQALYRRAALRKALGRLYEAESDLARAAFLVDSTGLKERASEIFEALGQIYQMQSERDAALSAYQRAVEVAKTGRLDRRSRLRTVPSRPSSALLWIAPESSLRRGWSSSCFS